MFIKTVVNIFITILFIFPALVFSQTGDQTQIDPGYIDSTSAYNGNGADTADLGYYPGGSETGQGTNESGLGGESSGLGVNSSNQVNSDSKKLINPITSPDIQSFLLKIVDVLLIFAIPIIVLYIMYSGYLFVVAQGNPGEIEHARSALFTAIIGGILILGAKLIFTVIEGTIRAF